MNKIMPKKICPKCGKEDDGAFLNAFCTNCFIATHQLYLLPDISVDECGKCGRIRCGKEWKAEPEKIVAELVKTKLKTPYDATSAKATAEKHKKDYTVDLRIELSVEGNKISAEEKVRVEKITVQCPDCGLRSGGYHEAIIQLRGPSKKVEAITNQLVKQISRDTFITKIIEQDNGLDLLVGKKRPALEAVSKLHVDYELTNKLTGVRDGRQLHRATVCIHL